MATKVGQPFSQALVEDDIKNLYASGMVENIRDFDGTRWCWSQGGGRGPDPLLNWQGFL